MIESRFISIRPPSEANSLLLPITYGCSNNKCIFCNYSLASAIRFQLRPMEDILADIDRVARSYAWSVDRVFLQDGDALAFSYAGLVQIVEQLNAKFPNLERIASYATPRDILRRSPEELERLRQLKLGILYMGVETGDEYLLKKIRKGVDRAEMVEAGIRVKGAGITLSATILLGLGGVVGSERHAQETARILTDIDPDFVGALTLMLEPGTAIHDEWRQGIFQPLSPFQYLEELKTIIAESDLSNCFFTSNHASNYLPLRVRLPSEKERALKLLDEVLARKDPNMLRPEFFRAL
ncbi:MAG: radical SAM protein [Chloroflexi bacterium]|nr:radical SAM protein [Chloroflexota bacterium]